MDKKKIEQGALIRAARMEMEFSQAEIAGKFNLCQREVSLIERGKVAAPVRLVQWAEAIAGFDIQQKAIGQPSREGREAALNGLSPNTCPYGGALMAARRLWMTGFYTAHN